MKRFFEKLVRNIQIFMYGRHGQDTLSHHLMWVGKRDESKLDFGREIFVYASINFLAIFTPFGQYRYSYGVSH